MEIDFSTTEWLTVVAIDANGEPVFEMRPHRLATADIGLPDGKMYGQWMELNAELPADALGVIDQELTRAIHAAARVAAVREP